MRGLRWFVARIALCWLRASEFRGKSRQQKFALVSSTSGIRTAPPDTMMANAAASTLTRTRAGAGHTASRANTHSRTPTLAHTNTRAHQHSRTPTLAPSALARVTARHPRLRKTNPRWRGSHCITHQPAPTPPKPLPTPATPPHQHAHSRTPTRANNSTQLHPTPPHQPQPAADHARGIFTPRSRAVCSAIS